MKTANATQRVEQRPLGATGHSVSALGLGCASYWARPGFPEKRARAVFDAALECGITLFDTGASYAAGEAERRLGRMIAASAARAEDLVIATKAGTCAGDNGRVVRDFSSDGITGQVEQSLRRLGTERIALLQLHGPEADDLTDELRTTLERLRAAGKVSLLGINARSEVLWPLVGQHPFDVLMPFVSVMRPHNAALARRAAAAGHGVLAAEPLARMRFAPPLAHWLTRASGLWYLARNLSRPGNVEERQRRKCLRKALAAPGWTRAQLALAWVLGRAGVSSAVFGTTSPEHVHELARACGRPLPDGVDIAVGKCHRVRQGEEP